MPGEGYKTLVFAVLAITHVVSMAMPVSVSDQSSKRNPTVSQTKIRNILSQLIDVEKYYRHLMIRGLLSESQIRFLQRVHRLIDHLQNLAQVNTGRVQAQLQKNREWGLI